MRPFPQQQAITDLRKPMWHVSGFKHYGACRYLQEFALLCCFRYCFITRLWSAAAQPWRKLKPLKALPCQVSSHIHCHMHRIVPTETTFLGLQFTLNFFEKKKNFGLILESRFLFFSPSTVIVNLCTQHENSKSISVKITPSGIFFNSFLHANKRCHTVFHLCKRAVKRRAGFFSRSWQVRDIIL